MDRERLTWLRIAAMGFDALALVATWFAVLHARATFTAWWPFDLVQGAQPMLPPIPIEPHEPLVLVVVPIWIAVLARAGSYHFLRRKSLVQIIGEVGGAVVLATMAVLALLFVLQLHETSRSVVAGYALASLPMLALSRGVHLAGLRALRRRSFDRYRVLLVGTEASSAPWLESVSRHVHWGIEVVGPLSVDDATSGVLAERLVEQPIDEVHVSAGLDGDVLQAIAASCDELGVRLSLDANFLGLRTGAVELEVLDGWSVLRFDSVRTTGLGLATKRLVDLIGAVLLLLLAAPLLVVVAVLIRLDDGGPALFVQERAGRFGRPFRMFKLRTMAIDAEDRLAEVAHLNEANGPVFKSENDPRVTRLGAWLRRSSVDELPQLVNVLLGQMSLVGPRPPLMEEVSKYERWQLRRLSMKPGLTCIWQVSGRSNLDFERWMELDLKYIDTWSLWLDLRLLARTVPAVVRGTGAR
jgi:exopolysaccharide biosynthesis polyprenyl glycosylphosphotransferase